MRLFLHLRPEPGDRWNVEVRLDDRSIGSFGLPAARSEEEFVVDVAHHLGNFAFDGQVFEVWPVCPDHQTHPLEAALDENQKAVWCCPVGAVISPIGQLGPTLARWRHGDGTF